MGSGSTCTWIAPGPSQIVVSREVPGNGDWTVEVTTFVEYVDVVQRLGSRHHRRQHSSGHRDHAVLESRPPPASAAERLHPLVRKTAPSSVATVLWTIAPGIATRRTASSSSRWNGRTLIMADVAHQPPRVVEN
jgi:hypothetical protein